MSVISENSQVQTENRLNAWFLLQLYAKRHIAVMHAQLRVIIMGNIKNICIKHTFKQILLYSSLLYYLSVLFGTFSNEFTPDFTHGLNVRL